MDQRASGDAGLSMTADGDDLTDSGSAPGSRSIKRTAEVVLLALIVGGFLVLGANWVWRGWGLVGRERQVTLSWECSNHVEWRDEERDIRWRVPQDVKAPAPTGASAGGADWPLTMATGTIHFDSPDSATFRSDAGGETPMVRVVEGQFIQLSCGIP